LGTPELLIILLVVLLLFGAKRLPEVAKGLGQSVKEFRTSMKDVRQDVEKDMSEQEGAVTAGPAKTEG
jgi:sec-independent protein translocase protein TatA